ncbi:MAG: polyphosphate polymerase domain-containing protein [Pirellulales bacterium]
MKFLVPNDVALQLQRSVRDAMLQDRFVNPETGTYEVWGTYFDTPRWDVFQRNAGFARKKFRLRRYPKSDVAYLERKRKRQGRVSKVRIPLSLHEWHRVIRGEAPTLHDDPVTLDWYLHRLQRRQLRPVVSITYERTPYMQMDRSGPIRLTVDRHLRCGVVEGDRSYLGAPLSAEMISRCCIVEMKFLEAMPLLFRDWIRDFGLVPTSFSKYRTAVSLLGIGTSVAGTDSQPSITE